jgi:two-component system chemotaxis response regulator CheB
MAAEAMASVLMRRLSAAGPLPCTVARDGERIRAGHVYIAPADHHMLLHPTTVVVSKGARENRYRPAIDPLFRSAAVAHGSRVIGVLLTGLLDDGTSGLEAIHQCGGVTVVQDPADAAYPDMPQSALNGAKIDHCVPVSRMGSLLEQLVRRRLRSAKRVPPHVKIEATIAERVLSDVEAVGALGEQVPYNCPDCGGVLWEMTHAGCRRYRCHTGHAFTNPSLLAAQSAKVEETLWVCLRMLEERRNLLNSSRVRGPRSGSARERATETEVHIARIRRILLAETKSTEGEVVSAR